MDEQDETAEELPLPIEGLPASEEPAPETEPEVTAVPRLYLLRPRGLRPAPRPARRRRRRLRNDCPPDRRRASGPPSLKPRLR